MNFEKLKEIGVEEEEVMRRFMQNEGLYSRILGKFLDDQSYSSLKEALEAQNGEDAFRAAHTLKGVTANLGLGNLYRVATGITEQLRPGKNGDMELVTEYMGELDRQYQAAREVILGL